MVSCGEPKREQAESSVAAAATADGKSTTQNPKSVLKKYHNKNKNDRPLPAIRHGNDIAMSRIPVELQAVFLLAGRGHTINHPPPENIANRVFNDPWMIPKQNDDAQKNTNNHRSASSSATTTATTPDKVFFTAPTIHLYNKQCMPSSISNSGAVKTSPTLSTFSRWSTLQQTIMIDTTPRVPRRHSDDGSISRMSLSLEKNSTSNVPKPTAPLVLRKTVSDSEVSFDSTIPSIRTLNQQREHTHDGDGDEENGEYDGSVLSKHSPVTQILDHPSILAKLGAGQQELQAPLEQQEQEQQKQPQHHRNKPPITEHPVYGYDQFDASCNITMGSEFANMDDDDENDEDNNLEDEYSRHHNDSHVNDNNNSHNHSSSSNTACNAHTNIKDDDQDEYDVILRNLPIIVFGQQQHKLYPRSESNTIINDKKKNQKAESSNVNTCSPRVQSITLKPSRSFDSCIRGTGGMHVSCDARRPPLKPKRSFDNGDETTRSSGREDFTASKTSVAALVIQSQQQVRQQCAQVDRAISTRRPPLKPSRSFDDCTNNNNNVSAGCGREQEQQQVEGCTVSSRRPPLKPSRSFHDH